MSSPLKFGVLGTGYWARTCHGAALAAHPGVELVGFWGRDAGRADHAAQQIGGTGFADLNALLDSVDAVAIALPPDVQPTLAVRAAEAGKHLVLEKPLALDMAAADAVVDSVAAAGVASVVFLTYRFDEQTAAWLHTMQELAAAHGPWEGALSGWTGCIDLPDSPYAQSTWRRARGGLWDWGPHALSVLDALMPGVERVAATRGVRDTVNLNLEHRGGRGSASSLTVTAAAGGVGTFLLVWGPGGRHQLPPLSGSYVSTYSRAIDQLLASGTTDARHRLDVAYARDLGRVLDAAERYLDRPVDARTVAVSVLETPG